MDGPWKTNLVTSDYVYVCLKDVPLLSALKWPIVLYWLEKTVKSISLLPLTCDLCLTYESSIDRIVFSLDIWSTEVMSRRGCNYTIMGSSAVGSSYGLTQGNYSIVYLSLILACRDMTSFCTPSSDLWPCWPETLTQQAAGCMKHFPVLGVAYRNILFIFNHFCKWCL